MAQIEDLILSKLDKMEASQEAFRDKATGQLSTINVRLSVVEHDVKELHRRMNMVNGCAGDLAEEIDDLQVVVEKLDEKKWTRGDKIKALGISLSAVFALAALVISVICH